VGVGLSVRYRPDRPTADDFDLRGFNFAETIGAPSMSKLFRPSVFTAGRTQGGPPTTNQGRASSWGAWCQGVGRTARKFGLSTGFRTWTGFEGGGGKRGPKGDLLGGTGFLDQEFLALEGSFRGRGFDSPVWCA